MTSDWTGIPELDQILADLTETAHGVLGADLVGVYLQGSFALGGADAESDCDFVAVTATPLTGAKLQALAALRGELPHRAGYWNAHLEGSYAPASDLGDLSSVGRPWPYVEHGSDTITLDGHCNTEVTRWILHSHGVTLYGPPARTVTAPVLDDCPRTSRSSRCNGPSRTGSRWTAGMPGRSGTPC